MYELTIQNKKGIAINFNSIGGPFTIIDIAGLGPAPATINTSPSSLLDGEKYNSSKVNMRTINLAFAVEKEAEANRLQAYKVFQSARAVDIHYVSSMLNVTIEGYIESVDVTHFEAKQVITVVIVCPFPYFKAAQQVVNELYSLINMFHFPFASTATPELIFGVVNPMTNEAVINNGAVECGLIFELYARDTLSNPKIYNYLTNEFIGLNFQMQAGDLITINTEKGKKSVTLLRDGSETNLFNYLMEGITWLQLEVGGSEFVYQVTSGVITNLLVTIKHNDLFEGV